MTTLPSLQSRASGGWWVRREGTEVEWGDGAELGAQERPHRWWGSQALVHGDRATVALGKEMERWDLGLRR